MTDTGESLTPKTVRADGCQVFKGLEFGCREPLAEDRQIVFLLHVRRQKTYVIIVWGYYIDTAAIVRNLEQFQSTIFHQDFKRCGASIYGVFDELF